MSRHPASPTLVCRRDMMRRSAGTRCRGSVLVWVCHPRKLKRLDFPGWWVGVRRGWWGRLLSMQDST